MGIASTPLCDAILGDWHAAFAALEWLGELGALDPVTDAPVDRYALADRDPAPRPLAGRVADQGAAPTAPAAPAARPRPAAPSAPPEPAAKPDPVALARAAAGQAASLPALQQALAAFDLCDLKRGARSTVFSDGNPAARVMVIGEAPGRDEDMQGKPFVGRAGQLLDRMFAAIGLSRHNPDAASAIYITNIMPWRPPSNREPAPDEMAMMVPFVQRHVALADPDLIVLMGNTPAQAVLGARGITRLRGQWAQAWGKPVLPMLHPAYLLRNPIAKREAWADLLALQAHLAANPAR